MGSKKFDSFEDAVRYCESRGSLRFFGREGDDFEKYVCTLTIGKKIYYIDIYESGLLKVVGEDWDRNS